MVNWFSHNVVLTFAVIVGVGLWLTKGLGGKFFGRFVFVVAGAFLALVLLTATIQSVEDWFNRFKSDIVGFLKNSACQKLGISALCDISDMADAKVSAEDRRMLCIENLLLVVDRDNGGIEVKQACGLRGDPKEWEKCVTDKALPYQKLSEDIVNGCPAYAPDFKFMHDVVEPIACLFGIKSWCTTQPAPNPASPAPANQAPAPDTNQTPNATRYQQCLMDAISRVGRGQQSQRCSVARTPQEWETCMQGVLCGPTEFTTAGCTAVTQCAVPPS